MRHAGAIDIISDRMKRINSLGLRRILAHMGEKTGPWVCSEAGRYLLMASNDYLGLSSHRDLKRAAADAILTLGAGSGASRLISGTLSIHLTLERRLADLFGTEQSLLFNTGYAANLGVVAGLCGKGDYIASDRLNHASIIDACRLSGASVGIYPHCDWRAAERLLSEAPEGSLKILVTEGLFSMDGDVAPLPELLGAARRQRAVLVIDDAHGVGVMGASGRGTLEYFGLGIEQDMVLIGTFSKALGGAGGFAAGAGAVMEYLVNSARSFIYTTAPPPAQAAACLAALEVLEREPWRLRRLFELCRHMRAGLERMGVSISSPCTPIMPLIVGEAGRALELTGALKKRMVIATAVRPPTVPPGTSRIRFTVTASHSEEDIEIFLEALGNALEELDG